MATSFRVDLVRVLIGDALTMLRRIEAESVHCIVTSPPYFQLRDYGVVGQIGLESSLDDYIDALLAVFDECRRVLRSDGVLYVNIGDSYSGSGKGPTGHNGIGDQERRQGFTGGRGRSSIWVQRGDPPDHANSQQRSPKVEGVRSKSLLLVPDRFKIAMQARGWIVRSHIAWVKRSAMPESVKDRPTNAWEPVIMFSKSGRYYWDRYAVQTRSARPGDGGAFGGDKGRSYNPASGDPNYRNGKHQAGREFYSAETANLRNYWMIEDDAARWRDFLDFASDYLTPDVAGQLVARYLASKDEPPAHDVWLLGPDPLKDAHYAAFPRKLAELAILAGTSEHGACVMCGAPWGRIVERSYANPGNRSNNGTKYNGDRKHQPGGSAEYAQRLEARVETLGWRPSCGCDVDGVVPASVLDPFAGSGTVGEVCQALRRDCTLIELSPDYAEIIRKRITPRSPSLPVPDVKVLTGRRRGG